jgi:chromosome segregation ATPase
MFGGVLLIAILVAVQIRQTDITVAHPEPSSPEVITALQEKLEQLNTDIKLATALRETLPNTILTPPNHNEQPTTQNYEQLQNTRITSTAKKNELFESLQKQKNENSQLEKQVKIIVTNIQTGENKINDLKQQAQNQSSQNNQQKQSIKLKQKEIHELKNQITQKEKKPTQSSPNDRHETLYQPKLHISKANKSAYLILRFNRIYDASSRDDFDTPNNNLLGTPKINRGITIDSSEKSKKEIQKILKKYNNKTFYVSLIVYGDTADQFYIIRNILLESGFEYDLKPSNDDSVWNFSSNSGTQEVQE